MRLIKFIIFKENYDKLVYDILYFFFGKYSKYLSVGGSIILYWSFIIEFK